MNNIETGNIGENIAVRYLLNNKYLILARNHKEKFDEIDIIARKNNGDLVFCEVKTLNNSRWFMPEDNLSSSKTRKMIRASRMFLTKHSELMIGDAGYQIDLIAIVLNNGKFSNLRHYENI